MNVFPFERDYGGNKWYTVAPTYLESGPVEWECPVCEAELDYNASHDQYTEGFAPQATPDVWRCENCDYQYSE